MRKWTGSKKYFCGECGRELVVSDCERCGGTGVYRPFYDGGQRDSLPSQEEPCHICGGAKVFRSCPECLKKRQW